MSSRKPNPPVPSARDRSFWVVLFCLAAALSALFWRSYLPGRVVFSNDGPLGAISSDASALPGTYTGYWQDLNWVGGEQPSAVPNISVGLNLAAGPHVFSKLYAPASMLILGLCAWVFFRQLRFNPRVCLLGALAAALNMHYFSTACWGVAAHPITVGMSFLALAALAGGSGGHRWLRVILAGLAVGMGIMEGYDIGAIFSLFVAAFVLFQCVIAEGRPAARLAVGAGRLVVVALAAAFIATHSLSTLVGTQIQGIVGTAQDEATRRARWDEATQWSLPKAEALRIVIPGLFGYRMHTGDGSEYWGSIGQQPGWEQHRQGLPRLSGGGEYAGMLVVLMAVYGAAHAFRRKDSPFTAAERKFIVFWLGVTVVALLMSFGRHAPIYQFFYALPYMSTIRNPAKFTHVLHWALLILAAYGLEGVSRRWLQNPIAGTGARFQEWWRRTPAFDRRWLAGMAAMLGVSLLGWLIYAGSQPRLIEHLRYLDFDPGRAAAIARFSVREAGVFVLFFALTAGWVWAVASGRLSGSRARWGVVAAAILLVVDLGRTNRPWIIHWDVAEKYASNPVVGILKNHPHTHRVTVVPFQVNEQLALFQQVYGTEWLQHLFQYHNVQSLDRVQEPRVAVENAAYRQALGGSAPALVRLWELTNTRYILGLAGNFAEALNQQLDPSRQRFRLHTPFRLYQTTPGGPILVDTNAPGPFALIEFTGALPRAALYTQWQVVADDTEALRRLASPDFDPARTVLVAEELPPPAEEAGEPQGGVEFVSYSPKRLVLSAKTDRPAVLLLNDKHNPKWRVTVNGEEAPLLRANFLMRGVWLKPGEHRVEFRFEPQVRSLYVSLAGIATGIVLLGYIVWFRRNAKPAERAGNPS